MSKRDRSRRRSVAVGPLISRISTAALMLSCTRLESARDEFGPGGRARDVPNGGDGAAAGSSSSAMAGAGAGGAPSAAQGGENQTPHGPSSGGGGNAGETPAGAAGASGNEECPALGLRPTVRLEGESGSDVELTRDTTWSCSNDYVLAGRVIVVDGVRLTIEPGVVVRAEPSSLLLVERGAELVAEGAREAPIVFTSAKEEGTRAPGDWRGVVLIGKGRSHATNRPVYDTTGDHRSYYGGGPEGDPRWACGSLRFVRVEFAGGNLDEEGTPGAALTLAGCGEETRVDHVQVHRGTDGLGLLGGAARLTHVIVTANSRGDAVEWTDGFEGAMQFVIAQSLGAGAAISGGNADDAPDQEPRSRPTIYNATLVGTAPLVSGSHFGVLLRFGTRAILKNSIIVGFEDAAFDLRISEDVLDTQLGDGKPLDISHVLFYGNRTDFTPGAAKLQHMASMRVDDPGLANATSRNTPDFRPIDPTVAIDAALPPAPLDTTAAYRGAVPREGPDWTEGWTAYPEN